MFKRSGIPKEPMLTMSDVNGNRKYKMAVTYKGSTNISVWEPESNEISNANALFHGSNIPIWNHCGMSDVSGNRKYKMAVT